MEIRSMSTTVHQTLSEAGAKIKPDSVIVTATIVVTNPLAGKGFVEDLIELEELGAEAAQVLVDNAIMGLKGFGIESAEVRSYGKGAIVGIEGDREHSAAILHPRFGAPVRAAIGGGADIIPGTKKVGPAGSSITMPLGNKDDRWQFDDMDAADVCIPDAPRPNEIVISLALGVGGRPNARVKKPGS